MADAKEGQAPSDEIAAAEALGVQGTPHFFLGQVKNGSLVSIRVLSGASHLSPSAR